MREYKNFASLEQFVLELILNSLKANSTAIAVRIDLNNQRIQVVDNGYGISKNALKNVGEKPAKNEESGAARKIKSTDSSRSLNDIRGISTVMIIASKSQSCPETYGKFFSKNRPSEISRMKNRPAEGTTVTAYVSKESCNWGNEIDKFAIRFTIVYLALVNKQVSFSVRDDSTGSILLRIGKHQKCDQLLKVICEQPVNPSQINIFRRKVSKNLRITSFWGYDCSRYRKIQQIFLNLRPVRCSEIENFIIQILTKICCLRIEKDCLSLDKIFFLFYIECPNSEYTFTVKNNESAVEFDDIDKILRCIEKSLKKTRSKSFKSTIYESAPVISHPIGRTLGLKRRKSFLTNVRRQSFENGAFFRKRESRIENKSKNETVQKEISMENNEESSTYHNASNSNEGTAERKNEGTSEKQNEKSLEKFQKAIESPQKSQGKDNDPFIKEYAYENHSFSWISQKCAEKITNNVEEIYISGCSQWSDWTYESDKKNNNAEINPPIYKRFKFLPLKLHALLPFGNAKFISRTPFENGGKIVKNFDLKFKHRRNDLDVRPCVRRSFEIRLKLETLQSMKVLNQVNHEFIVAITKQDGKKLLVVIDQHAMHERIRYENLLRAYRRDQQNNQFISVFLNRPIIISDFSPETCELLEANRCLLIRYGLSLAFRDEKTFLILTVPRCFPKKSYHADNTEMENLVRKLLQEVLEHLNGNSTAKFLPFTIHNAIASEACHGAIKFGNPLTVDQCESLVSLWRETEAPNRCAHGRPSIIPLLELSVLKRNRYRFVSQEKLNFASLRNSRWKREGTTRFHPYIGGNFQEI